MDFFKSAYSTLDYKRNCIFNALLTNNHNSLDSLVAGLPRNSFERALYHYSAAYLSLKAKLLKHPEIRNHLHEAERIFRSVPSLFWLGKLFQLKTEFFLNMEDFEKAKISLQSAHNIFSRLGAKREILKLNRLEIGMKNPSDMLNTIAERLPYKVLLMVKEVLTERNPEKMINRILSTSLEFTDMERAVLILAEDPPRIFKSATFDDSSVQEIYEISRSAMEEATESHQTYVRLNAVEDPYLKGKPSIVANRIGSILCLPLRSAEKTIGVLYLDSREGISSVAKTESVLLEIFSNIMSLVLEDAVDLEKSRRENEILKQSIQNNHFGRMLGTSKAIEDLKKTVYRLSTVDHHILITGETGVGKELIARMLHECSKRKDASFIAINCASLPEMLLESELFGHEKGAFTDANYLKKGLFEEAQDGTLFLDEIGELPYSVQAKLLRVLQEREFRRVGGNSVLHFNAHIILATNKDLLEQVRKNQFREDLYYRISGVQIHVPSLRERKEDIALLAKQFLKSADASNKFRGFSRDAINLMEQYSWPGNIRQLKYEVERIAALCENPWIQVGDYSKLIQTSSLEESKIGTLKSIEREVIQERLKQFDWNIVRTANSLGLTRHGLYSKMKLFGIKRNLNQNRTHKKV
jgi:Nif-specific regulatory protein